MTAGLELRVHRASRVVGIYYPFQLKNLSLILGILCILQKVSFDAYARPPCSTAMLDCLCSRRVS